MRDLPQFDSGFARRSFLPRSFAYRRNRNRFFEGTQLFHRSNLRKCLRECALRVSTAEHEKEDRDGFEIASEREVDTDGQSLMFLGPRWRWVGVSADGVCFFGAGWFGFPASGTGWFIFPPAGKAGAFSGFAVLVVESQGPRDVSIVCSAQDSQIIE